jgi:hypothetical protein
VSIEANTDSGSQRRTFVIGMSILVVLGFGGWMLGRYFAGPLQFAQQELPFRYNAGVAIEQGFLGMDPAHYLYISHDAQRSTEMRYESNEWPLACRFYSDKFAPDSLIILQLNPELAQDDPGVWLNAQTLQKIALENLPLGLVQLDRTTIE